MLALTAAAFLMLDLLLVACGDDDAFCNGGSCFITCGDDCTNGCESVDNNRLWPSDSRSTRFSSRR